MEAGRTALIIEDECTVVYLLKEVLKNKGIDAVQANCIKDAHLLMLNIHPDFIFVDNELPDGLGFDTICTMHLNNPEARIIAMSAQASFRGKENAFNVGANYFLEKPFTLEQVYNSLKKESKEVLIMQTEF